MKDATAVVGRWLGDREFELTPVTTGATNAVSRVRAGSDVLYLRGYSRLSGPEVLREHRLIHHVRDRGVPAPLPRETLDGSTAVEHLGVAYALFESAVGEQREPDELRACDARASGEMLGQVHDVIADFDGAPFRPLALQWDGPAWTQRLDRIVDVVGAKAIHTEADAWALERAQAQREWMGDPRCGHSYEPTAPSQLIHGDYQHANLFFEGGKVTGVIDWDNITRFPRAFEIARSCAFMFRFDKALTRAFVDGYRSVSELSEEELADGAAAWGCYYDHHVWALEETYLNGNPAAARFIPPRRFVPFADEWAELGVR